MAAQVFSRAVVPREAARWKWSLLALCMLAAGWILFAAMDQLGFGGPPWYGWWDAFRVASDHPYSVAFMPPRQGGATMRAGIHAGDRADARDQTYAGRVVLFTQPLTTKSTTLVVHRGSKAFTTHVTGSTISDGEPFWKLPSTIPQLLVGAWFLACALLIAVRRAEQRNARTLALILLLLTPRFFIAPPISQNATATLMISAAIQAFGCVALALLVRLSSTFGVRPMWRLTVEGCVYAAIALDMLWHAAFYVGIVTLAVDPVRYWSGSLGVSFGDIAVTLIVLLVIAAAVLAVPASQRPRSAWLLLPLPIALFGSTIFAYLGPYASTWVAAIALELVAFAFELVGALAVTYALLKRRVLDFEFVLSRTLVVAAVSLIIVASFVLLEWLLGTVVAGVSHATGLIANGALALVLGLSLRYIHKRVDVSVDAVLFRRRHDDERALRNFSKEAAYITDRDALIDQTISNIRDHTDARSAAILLDDARTFRMERSFGDGVPSNIGENDPAILALKTWHKPLDPHRCETALRGALALPMVARGRLLGVLILGERARGEAYAPDDIEALSLVAQGAGAALDALRAEGETPIAQMRTSLTALANGMASLGEKIDSLAEKLARATDEP